MEEDNNTKEKVRQCSACGAFVKWPHGSKPQTCPYCGSIHWDKPKDECSLFILQDKYLESRDTKYLQEMYPILIKYTKKIILKMLRGSVSYDEDTLEDRVVDTVTYFLSYYLRNKSFYVYLSFGKLLFQGAHQQLHNKKRQDIDTKEISYDNSLNDEGTNTFIDEMEAPKIINTDSNKECELAIMKFIDSTYIELEDDYDISMATHCMILLLFFVEGKSNSYFDDYYNTFGTNIAKVFKEVKNKFVVFLKEQLEDNSNYDR